MTVAPVIEVIPNDVEVQGNLTVTGEYIGLPDVDSGLPAGGEEGQVLSIMNGEPTWVFFEPPEPPPPAEALVLTDQRGTTPPGLADFGMYNGSTVFTVPSEPWDDYIRTLSTWGSTKTARTGLGAVQSQSGNIPSMVLPFQLELFGGTGKVIEIGFCSMFGQYSDNTAHQRVVLTCDNANVVPIVNEATEPGFHGVKSVFSFLLNRPDLGPVNFELKSDFTDTGIGQKVEWSVLQYFQYVDSADYLRKLLRQKAIQDAVSNCWPLLL